MSNEPLFVAAAALVVLASGVAGAFAVSGGLPGMRAVAQHERRLERDLSFLHLSLRARRVVVVQALAVAAVVGAALALGSALPLPLSVPLLLAPRLWLGARRAERVARLEQQLDGWLTTLASALGATGSLGEALQSTVALVPSPMCDEVRRTLGEYRLGTPLDLALDSMSRRIESRSIDGALLALRIARNHGGDLPATLRVAAATLRELGRLEGVVRTKTAEGKAQAVVISIIPAPLLGCVHWMAPGYLDPLLTTSRGYLIIAVACVLWSAAIAMAAKIVAVEV